MMWVKFNYGGSTEGRIFEKKEVCFPLQLQKCFLELHPLGAHTQGILTGLTLLSTQRSGTNISAVDLLCCSVLRKMHCWHLLQVLHFSKTPESVSQRKIHK